MSKEGIVQRVSGQGETDSLASQLATKLNELLRGLGKYNEEAIQQSPDGLPSRIYTLQSIAAPRFWKPNDPVVLLVEKEKGLPHPGLQNDRHALRGENNLLECSIVETNLGEGSQGITAQEWIGLARQLNDLFRDQTETGLSLREAIWNPFMLEWEVEYQVALPGSNHVPEGSNYAEDYIRRHFKLPETASDFSLRSAKPEIFFPYHILFWVYHFDSICPGQFAG